jgi:ketosteroid isomerase-like protein
VAEETSGDERRVDLEERIKNVEDQLAIHRLVNSWGPAVDTGDSAAAAALWAEDGVLESDLSHLVGPDAVAAMVKSDGQRSLIREGCAHVQAFPLVTIDGDMATATGYSRVYRFRDGAHEIWRISANRWEFRRTPAGWRISRRVNHVIDGGPEARDLLNRGLD